MKHLLHSLALRVTMLIALLVSFGSSGAWADTNVNTISTKFSGNGNVTSSFTQTGDFTSTTWDLDVTWKSNASWQPINNTKGVQIGTASLPATGIVLTGSGISGTITSVAVNTSGANSVNATVAVSVGGTGFTYGGNNTASLTSSATSYTFTGSASGDVVLTWANSSDKAIYVKSITVTYSTVPVNPTCATPTFSPAPGTYGSAQNVTISTETEGASIYYTTNGDAPTSSSTPYSSAISVSETMTIKAIAVKDGFDNSSVASAAYTIVHPLTTMDAIFNAATEAGSTATQYYVTLDDWVVSGVNGSTAYVTDNNGKGFIVYKSGHGFTVGNILSGTVQASLKLYNEAAEFTTLTSSTTGLSVTTGGTLDPIVTNINDLSGVNTGALIQVNDVTYDGTNTVLEDESGYTIKPYNSLYNSMSFTSDTKYNVTGVYLQYGNTKEIMPRSADDIEEVTDPTITADPATATAFTYEEGNGPSSDQIFTVTGAHLVSSDITATVSSDYEISDDDEYSSAVTIASGDVVSVRLKAGLAKGIHNGTLTLSSTDANNVVINLSGSVTGTTYTISVDDEVTGGTIEADLASAEEGATVTLTATPNAAYTFGSWTVYEDDMSTEVTVTDNQFTMPDCEVFVTATFNAKPTYAITCAASPVAGGTLEASPASAYEGQTVTLSYLAEDGYNLSSIVITKTSDASATDITPVSSGDDYTFTMPGYAVTATATFESNLFEGTFAKVTSTSALEDGGYYILYSTKAMNATVTSGKMGATAVTINNDIIENPDKSIVWKLVQNGDKWDLYSEKEEKYCYIEGTNTSAFKMAGEASYHFAVTDYASGGGFKFKTNHTSGRGINYGSDNFGSYADSNSPTVYLYKYTVLTPRTITFDGNGGTYNEASTYTQDVNDGVETTLQANQFIRDGYEFVAWNDQANGEGANTYDDEAAITVTGGDFTLYAQWAPLYTMTIDNSIEGGSVAVEGNVTSTIEGDEITLTYTPSSGYGFSAWNVYKEGDTSTKVIVTNDKFTMPAYNVVISATFEEVQTYTLLTDVSQLVSGKHYIIASGTDGSVKAMGLQNDNNRAAVTVTASSGVIPETTGVYEFVIYGPDANSQYEIYDDTNSKFLYAASSSSNYLKMQTPNNANGKWTITIGNTGIATITAKGTNTRNVMQYNSGSTLFSCYASANQAAVYLYVKDGEATPTESVTVGAAGYTTYTTQNPVSFPDGVTGYIVTATGTSSATLTSKESVPARTPVVIKASAGTYNLPVVTTPDVVTGNLLKASTGSTKGNGSTIYALAKKNGEVGFYLVANEVEVPAGKAYLDLSVPGVKEFLGFTFGDETKITETAEKTEGTESLFDLSGRRVNKAQKGLYIVNGRKVLVK